MFLSLDLRPVKGFFLSKGGKGEVDQFLAIARSIHTRPYATAVQGYIVQDVTLSVRITFSFSSQMLCHVLTLLCYCVEEKLHVWPIHFFLKFLFAGAIRVLDSLRIKRAKVGY